MWTKAHWSVRGLRGAWWSACVLAVLCGGTAAWAATVTGTITADGQPLPGAWIHMDARAHGRLHSAQTDEQGNYTIENLAPGSYRVFATAREYSFGHKEVTVRSAEQALTVHFELRKLCAISGTILLASGHPLAHAQVLIRFYHDNGWSGGRATTEIDGTYRCVSHAEPGSLTVGARTAGYAVVTVPNVTLRAGADTPGVDFVLKEPAASISGVVYAADGATPVAGVEVRVWPVTSTWGRRRDYTMTWSYPAGIPLLRGQPRATSGPDGSFTIDDLEAGHYTVGARAPGFQATFLWDPVQLERSEQRRDVNIVLKEAGQIRGTVYDKDARPLRNRRVRVHLQRETGQREPAAEERLETDDEGGYIIHHLPDGAYVLALSAEDTVPATREVIVEAGRTTEGVDFRLGPGVTLSGTVSDANGKPVGEAEVDLEPVADLFGKRPFAYTDIEGRFRIEHLAPGSYDFVAAAHGTVPTAHGQITLETDGSTRLDIRLAKPAAIRGRVIADDGTPVAGAHVECDPVLHDPGPVMRIDPMLTMEIEPRAVTDRKGAYAVEELTVGRFWLRAEAEGYKSARTEVAIDRHGEVLRAPDLVLPRLLRMAGRILMPDGKTPVRDRQFHVTRLRRGTTRLLHSGTSSVRTDADGRFVVDDVPVTTPALRFRTDGLSPAELEIDPAEAGARGLEVTLPPTTTIRGRLKPTDGELPADGVYIVAGPPTLRMGDWDPDPARLAGLGVFCTKPVRPAQRWIIQGISPGRYGLQVLGEGLAPIERSEVTVAEGETVEVDLQVSAGGSIAGRVTTLHGEPVAAARVRVPMRGFQVSDVVPSAIADEDGRYLIEHVTPGVRRLKVSASGFAHAELDGVTVAEGLTTEDVDLELFVGGTIVGKVRTPDGTPPRREYNVHLAGGPDYGWANMRADGTFELKHILPGTYEVVLGRPKPYTAVATEPNVVVSEGQTTPPIEFVVPE